LVLPVHINPLQDICGWRWTIYIEFMSGSIYGPWASVAIKT